MDSLQAPPHLPLKTAPQNRLLLLVISSVLHEGLRSSEPLGLRIVNLWKGVGTSRVSDPAWQRPAFHTEISCCGGLHRDELEAGRPGRILSGSL